MGIGGTRTSHTDGNSRQHRAEQPFRWNRSAADQKWGGLARQLLHALKELTVDHRLCVRSGDLLLLEGRWYVTHTGLLRLARRSRCAGISVEAVPELSDPACCRWAFKAIV